MNICYLILIFVYYLLLIINVYKIFDNNAHCFDRFYENISVTDELNNEHKNYSAIESIENANVEWKKNRW